MQAVREPALATRRRYADIMTDSAGTRILLKPDTELEATAGGTNTSGFVLRAGAHTRRSEKRIRRPTLRQTRDVTRPEGFKHVGPI